MTTADIYVPDTMPDFPSSKKSLALSNYFPKGTNYFYAYPAGESSGFLNKVSPSVEELVAARALSCAGPDVNVVKFAATHSSVIGVDIIEALGIPQLPDEQLTILPKHIDASVAGETRNSAIKEALEKSITPGSLVMAQPYTDKYLAYLFQIPTQLSTWINDKNNMKQYINAKHMPKKQGVYLSGEQLTEHQQDLTAPCVVKVSSSSSGDGVYLCHSNKQLKAAIHELKPVNTTIFVEQLIDAKRNYCIHFGIPFDSEKPIDLIGANQQLTTSEGEFMGGIIDSATLPEPLLPLERYLLDDVLPKIRAMGWYGIGCFDVLCDANDKLYLIDCNFRITGMSAYHFLLSNSVLSKPILSFGGEFVGSRKEFEKALLPYAGKNTDNQIVQIIALTRYDNSWNFNGALMYKNYSQLTDQINELLKLGIKSAALESIVNGIIET